MEDEIIAGNDLNEKMNLMLKQNFKITTQLTLQETQLKDIKNNIETFNTRLDGLETNYKMVSDKVDNLTENNNKIIGIANEFASVRESCQFISDKYDETAGHIDKIITHNKTQDGLLKSREKECAELKQALDNLRNEFNQERVNNNEQHQYYRTCFHLKLCGVPVQPGEEEKSDSPSNPYTLKAIEDVCSAAKIKFDANMIDVCHRLGTDDLSPIIIRFCSKSARFYIYNQRNQLSTITSNIVNFRQPEALNMDSSGRGRRGGRGGSKYVTRASAQINTDTPVNQHSDDEGTRIYIQEHLTKFNKSLLNEMRTRLKDHKYPGYVKHGTLRTKTTAESKFQIIRSSTDIDKILI